MFDQYFSDQERIIFLNFNELDLAILNNRDTTQHGAAILFDLFSQRIPNKDRQVRL